jgi:hypothetical protein
VGIDPTKLVLLTYHFGPDKEDFQQFVEKRRPRLTSRVLLNRLSVGGLQALCAAYRALPRAERLSATRAAHRVLRRVRDSTERARGLRSHAHAATEVALGHDRTEDKEYDAKLEADPAWLKAEKLDEFCERIGYWLRCMVPVEGKPGRIRGEFDHWCTTISIKGRLYFHPPDVPVRVWAVAIGAGGITWTEAEVIKVTARNVMVRYAGEIARLDRGKLWHWWAWWRGVMFVSCRTGRIAAKLDELWWKRYGATGGGVPPSMQMPLAEAMALLGVPADYTKDDVISAFRKAALKAHPDQGGTAEMFRKLVEARDRLLTALGTSAPPPKPPTYAPAGATIVYRSGRSSQRPRLGHGVRRLS